MRSSSALAQALDDVAADVAMTPIRASEGHAARVAPMHVAVGTAGRLPDQPGPAGPEWKSVA
jgi:hypothetical protein